MVESARFARRCGAAWLILQPPRPPATAADLIEFFGTIADRVDCPVAIQNAPEFLGLGLSASELIRLAHHHPNVRIVKAESSAVAVARLIEAIGTRIRVFNGRAGLELVDNFRAGVHGMIPGVETVDFQVGIEKAVRLGDMRKAESLYGSIAPALSFIMQGLPHFVLYGKLIAALRLGIAPSHNRRPADEPSAFGIAAAHRFADVLGPLPQ
jgi:2-keto-3-deoxy-L-arabinonate dehydratase